MDDPLIRATSTTRQYYHPDGLGSIVGVTDQNGATVGTNQFDAWGNRIAASGTVPLYGYTGREPDATGLIYYRARYYDPTIGRFIQRDPIGFAGGDLNLYVYVGNNPVNAVDPEGLTGWFGAGVGALSGGLGGYYSGVQSGAKGLKLAGLTALGIVVGAGIGFATPQYSGTAAAATVSFLSNTGASFVGQAVVNTTVNLTKGLGVIQSLRNGVGQVSLPVAITTGVGAAGGTIVGKAFVKGVSQLTGTTFGEVESAGITAIFEAAGAAYGERLGESLATASPAFGATPPLLTNPTPGQQTLPAFANPSLAAVPAASSNAGLDTQTLPTFTNALSGFENYTTGGWNPTGCNKGCF
jgi:RHS repeat-associated protein